MPLFLEPPEACLFRGSPCLPYGMLSPEIKMRILQATRCAAALTLVACGGSGGTGPGGQSPSLSITLPATQMVSGTIVQAAATMTNASGQTSPATNVTWSSSNSPVASVSVGGAVATFAVATGAGTMLAPTSPASGANGVAIAGLWTLGSVAGEQTVTATVAGVGSVTFKGTAR